MSPRHAVLAAVLVLASARPSHAECAKEGHSLSPAADFVSPKQIERTARTLLGPTFGQIVHKAPWGDMWLGDVFDLAEPSFFLQAFDKKLVLPRLRFPIAAPKPFTITAELDIDTSGSDCVLVEVSRDTTGDDGAVTVRAPMTATISITVARVTERVSLPAAEAFVRWHRDGRRLTAELVIGDLELGLTPHSTDVTVDEVEHERALGVGKDVLVRSLERAGSHRKPAIALLRAFGFGSLSGDTWVRLRQLQAANKLSTKELAALDWLARRPVFISGTDVATFTSPANRPVPRVFVGGHEITGWTLENDRNELRVGVTGLSAVRVEFSDGSSQSFVTVLDRDVRIRLLNIWGATLETPVAGPRCGVVHDHVRARCGMDPVTPDKPFDLRSCGGAAAEGSIVSFGVSLVASMPGLYVYDRMGLRFEPDGACSP